MRVLALALALAAGALLAAAARVPQAARQADDAAQTGPVQHSAKPSADNRIPPDHAADSYAIYSLLMPGRLFEQMSGAGATRWAIARDTITYGEMNPRIDPRGALKPPPGHGKVFRQAVHEFEVSRSVSYTLRARLHLDRPYDLLDPAQVRALRDAKSSVDPGAKLKDRYAAYPGITFFSAVYFSNDQKAALVYMNDWCGVLCSQGQWVYLEKQNGGWERVSGITVPGA